MIRMPHISQVRKRDISVFGPCEVLYRPGQILYCDDPKDVKIIEVRAVPDPAHQSSLDYLKGV